MVIEMNKKNKNSVRKAKREENEKPEYVSGGG